jgi:hypothetical protein
MVAAIARKLQNHVTRCGILFVAMFAPECLRQALHYANWLADVGAKL